MWNEAHGKASIATGRDLFMWRLRAYTGCLLTPLLLTTLCSFLPDSAASFFSLSAKCLHSGIADRNIGIRLYPWAGETSRRSVLEHMLTGVVLFPLSGNAEDGASSEGLMSTERVAQLLHHVPTFTLVDKRGVPFMVVGEDAKVTGYFFTEYDEAARILRVARESADKALAEARNDPLQKDSLKDLTNPWKEARISTFPLDSAVTLVTKSLYGLSRGGGNYFQVAASEADIDDALTVTGKGDLAEGKVPLFYFENFTYDDNGEKKSPLFFRKTQLEDAYRAQNPGTSTSKVLVTELFAVLGEMVKPGGKDDNLKTLVFVPPAESVTKAQECTRKGGKEAPFLVGERIVVL